VDTGVAVNHPDFNGNAGNFWKKYGSTDNYNDEHGHGTNVAGSVLYTAPSAKIVNVKMHQV
jgi:subtilisin family serine protease